MTTNNEAAAQLLALADELGRLMRAYCATDSASEEERDTAVAIADFIGCNELTIEAALRARATETDQ